MKKAIFWLMVKGFACGLFFLAVFFTPLKGIFAVDLADERLQNIEQGLQQSLEILEETEDVLADAELSDEEIDRILTPAAKPVAQKDLQKQKEAQVKKTEEERQRLAQEKERQEEIARREEELKARQAQLAAEKERLAKEAAAKKAEQEQQRLAQEKQRQEELARKEQERKQREAQLAAEKERLAKEAQVKKTEEERQRLAQEKERQEEIARREEELKARQAQLAADKERLAQEAAAKKAEVERLQKQKEQVKLAMVQKETPQPSPQESSTKASVPGKKITLKELKEILGLTDKQMERLTPIVKEKAGKRREIIAKYTGKGEAAKSALKQELLLFQKYYDNMYSHILTEEQWARFMALRQENKSR